MKTALLVLLCVAAVFAAEYEHEDNVVVLTDANFDQALNEFDFALVEFYAPWCGHCKTLAPQYAEAATKLAQTHPNVKLCKLDATIHKDAAAKFEVRGFPTLKFFRKGEQTPIAYEAGRTAPDIINWLKKKTGATSVQIHSVEEAEKLIGDNQVVALFFGADSSEAYKSFISVAQALDDVTFAHSHDENVLKHYGVSEEGLTLFKKFDDGKNVYTGAFNNADITEFLNKNRFPTVLPFDQKVAQRIFGEGLDAIFLVRGDDEAGQRAEEVFVKAAETLKGKLAISLARIEDSLGQRLAEYIGISKESVPAVKIVQPSKSNQKFTFDKELTAENLIAFVEEFRSGSLKTSL